MIEMPQYVIQVWALQIAEVHAQFKLEGVTGARSNGVVLTFKEPGSEPQHCTQEWIDNNDPQPGHWLVWDGLKHTIVSPEHFRNYKAV